MDQDASPAGRPDPLTDTLLEAFEHADVAVIVTLDHGERVERIYANAAAARLSGYTRAELCSQAAGSITVEPTRSEIERIRREVAAGGRPPTSFEGEFVARDGRRVPIQVGLASATWRGLPTSVAFIQDLTATHAVRRALEASEQRFRQLAEVAPDAIVVSSRGRVLYANQTTARILGFDTVEEFVARPLTGLVVPEEVPIMFERIGRVLAGERLPPWEYRGLRKDGSIAVMEISSVATLYEGQPAVVAFARDVTERKALLGRALQQQRLASVGTLAAGVAHEVNNPLTFVLLHLELLRRHAEAGTMSPAVVIGHVEEALGGVERVRRIVQDILAFSRPSEDVVEAIDVERVVASALRLARTSDGGGVRVETHLDGLPRVATNGARLGQVVLNVLVNALQALAGRADGVVVVVGRVVGAHLVLEVTDNGPGIPAATLARVWDPFFTTKPPGKGTGLGLTVSHAIVTAMGGQMRISSEPGSGTQVHLEVPLRAEDVRPFAESTAPVAPPGAPRVLVIDDEPAVARVIALLLGREHHTARCGDAEAALRLLAADADWDAVVCDVRLSGLSGPALHERVRQSWPALAPRFLFITGGALEGDEAAHVAESGCQTLQKPFDAERLLAAVSQTLGRGRRG